MAGERISKNMARRHCLEYRQNEKRKYVKDFEGTRKDLISV
jgi:hypothetical protein